MRHIDISVEQAKAYFDDKGYYPLVVDEEYVYLGQFVRLLEASTRHARIETRLGVVAVIHPSDLDWKH